MDNLFEIIEKFVFLKFAILIIIILYFVVLIAKVCDIAKNSRDMYNNQIEELELLERIAKALEQEPEPYVIESDDEKT